MLDMALDHFKAGRLAEAADCCGKLLNRRSRDFQALHLLGRILTRNACRSPAGHFSSDPCRDDRDCVDEMVMRGGLKN